MKVRRILAIAAGAFCFAVTTTGTARAASCDRACLQNLLTTYIDAMVAHAPAQLPLAAHARFTEDSHELKIGDGLWKTVTRKGSFRQDYIDQKQQIAAAHVELFEGETQVLYTVVLHTAKAKINGIETLVYRVPPDEKNKPDQLGKPLAGMIDPVPAGKAMPRAEMVRVALTYTEGLHRGAFFRANVPFAPEGYRLENGVKTAGEGCIFSKECVLRLQKGSVHPDVRASVAAIDEQAGIVLLWMNFGDTHTHGPNNALITFEAFKVWGGEIHAINAFFRFLPKETERGWASAEAATPAVPTANCNRGCLQNLLTNYIDAMVTHAPTQLPVAADVRFTEDSHELKLGEGLWKSVTRKGDFRQDYIDQSKQLAATHVELFEGETQVLYSVVLHGAKGKISGIETLVYRVPADAKPKLDQLNRPLPGMNDPIPAGKKMARAEMVRTALVYTQGLKIGSFVKAETPFAPEAYRVENGVRWAGDGCAAKDCAILTQKIMLHPDIKPSVALVDEEAGIVLLWMNFGDTHSYGPNKALVTFEAFKIWGGSIHTVNAFMGFLPKETERGWPSAE